LPRTGESYGGQVRAGEYAAADRTGPLKKPDHLPECMRQRH